MLTGEAESFNGNPRLHFPRGRSSSSRIMSRAFKCRRYCVQCLDRMELGRADDANKLGTNLRLHYGNGRPGLLLSNKYLVVENRVLRSPPIRGRGVGPTEEDVLKRTR